MNRRNMERLAARLQQLGFADDIQYRLQANVCFVPPHFEIPYQINIGADRCYFFVHCARGDQGLYDAVYFTACLRRMPEAAAEFAELDQSMTSINWQALYQSKEGLNVGDSIPDAYLIAELLQSVNNVDGEGIIRFRHWCDTSLENMVPNFSFLKNQYEISQRFYLIDDDAPISFADAMRFLQSRWMERKVNADRKLLVKNNASDTRPGGAAGKLLTKRVRPNRKPGNQIQ
jgi:hypothetical protein